MTSVYFGSRFMSSPQAPAIIVTEEEAGIFHLRLSNGARRNPLSLAVLQDISAALDEMERSQNVHVLVISAEGPAFCAGHDLKELHQRKEEPEFVRELFVTCSDVMKKIVRFAAPTIVLVDGIATAAGCQMVASCDVALATPRAQFGTPGVKIGLFCSTPMVALSRKVGHAAAMEMLLTGRHIGADEACQKGLVTKTVRSEDLWEQGLEMARVIAGFSSKTLSIGKEAFYRQSELSLDDAYDYAAGVMAHNMGLPDAHEGIAAFLEKRTPTWE